MLNKFFTKIVAIRVKALLIVMLTLTACGYHLRGAIDLPEELQKMYVRGASVELSEAIKQAFRSTSGELVANAADAGMILNVINEDYRRQTISISSAGYSNEYELIYRLTFDLIDKNGSELVSEQTVEASRSYYNEQSSDTVIAKDNEERVIRKELYIKVVNSVIARARAELKKAAP